MAVEHGDLWPNNCFINNDQIGVIDWEDCSWDKSPLYDLFFFITTYSFSYPWKKYQRALREDAFSKAFLDENWYSKKILACVVEYFAKFNIPAEAAHPLYFSFLMDAALHYVGWNLGIDNIWLSLIPLYVEDQERSIFRRSI
jgi:hypothetical protein